MFRKIVIYGAGAIGGWIGAALARAGREVGVVARGRTLDAIRSDGLRIEQDGTPPQTFRVPASDDPAHFGRQDLVVLAVKAPALADVARTVHPLLGADTAVLSAMNGVPWWFFAQGFGGEFAGTRLETVDPGGMIAAAIPAHRVIGGVVHASCSLAGPGFVRHHFGNRIIVGEPSGEIGERVRALAALLDQGGIEAPVSERIQRDIWFKLWGNMTVNPISAITGATTDRILADELVRRFVSDVMLEAREIGARIGLPIDQAPEDRHAVTLKLGAFKSSMLQDVENRRPVELDALVAVVRELGQRTRVPTPFTDALLGLARLHARVQGLYP